MYPNNNGSHVTPATQLGINEKSNVIVKDAGIVRSFQRMRHTVDFES